MNPGNLLLLLLSLAFACLSLLAHGWTLNGIGPAVLSMVGGFWQIWMEWFRYRSWLQHRDSGFVPGTQHLAISGWLGWSLALGAAVIWSMVTLKELRQRLPTSKPSTSLKKPAICGHYPKTFDLSRRSVQSHHLTLVKIRYDRSTF